ncbi:HPr family phosphocarrier protein [Vallitalea okinawensis]|uniref:HPr family phosphocarrier protein n=1 Tax=Vallitalea okinawensis TaxID=2078660 RepID=UPI000CFCCAF8|nr:HPr family phosphocarrier protein [Vallitalea okinawensis]
MVKQTVEVTNPTGLHARPAADFIKIASSLPCDVSIEKNGKEVNAKSILGLLALAIAKGDCIDIITDGEGEQDGLKKLVDFVKNIKE